MWVPSYKGDFKKLKGKNVKVTHKYNDNEFDSVGSFLDLAWSIDFIKESYIIIKIYNSQKRNNVNTKSIFFIGEYMNALPYKSILKVDIECDEVEDLIKIISKKSLCLDVANIILEFSGKYIPF